MIYLDEPKSEPKITIVSPQDYSILKSNQNIFRKEYIVDIDKNGSYERLISDYDILYYNTLKNNSPITIDTKGLYSINFLTYGKNETFALLGYDITNKIVLYYTKDGSYFLKKILINPGKIIDKVIASDVNNDGFIDIVSKSLESITYYFGGDGNFLEVEMFKVNWNTNFELSYLNKDSTKDIIIGNCFSLSPQNMKYNPWNVDVVLNEIPVDSEIYTGDINKDKITDIIYYSYKIDSKIYACINNIEANGGFQIYIFDDFVSSFCSIVDINKDGLNDIVFDNNLCLFAYVQKIDSERRWEKIKLLDNFHGGDIKEDIIYKYANDDTNRKIDIINISNLEINNDTCKEE